MPFIMWDPAKEAEKQDTADSILQDAEVIAEFEDTVTLVVNKELWEHWKELNT